MEFHNLVDQYTNFRKHLPDQSAEEFYSKVRQIAAEQNNAFAARQSLLEELWVTDKRPYYNIWPVIIPMVDKLSLDMPCSAIKFPRTVLLLRMPVKDNPFAFDGGEVKTALFGLQPVAESRGSKRLIEGMSIMFDVGEKDSSGLPIFTFKNFPLRSDMTVDQAANDLPFHKSWHEGTQMPQELITRIVRLCVCVCLIGNDPDLVSADVLSKDRPKYEKADEEQRKVIEDRARRRGKFGFHLGARMQSNPHWRRFHLAKFWVGKGRTRVIVQLRKGAIIHREKITKVPTGDDNQ